jgi:hypothetical protein
MTEAQRYWLPEERAERALQAKGHLPLESFKGATDGHKRVARKIYSYENPNTDDHKYEPGVLYEYVYEDFKKAFIYGIKGHFIVFSETEAKCTKCNFILDAKDSLYLARHAASCKGNDGTHCDICERAFVDIKQDKNKHESQCQKKYESIQEYIDSLNQWVLLEPSMPQKLKAGGLGWMCQTKKPRTLDDYIRRNEEHNANLDMTQLSRLYEKRKSHMQQIARAIGACSGGKGDVLAYGKIKQVLINTGHFPKGVYPFYK